MLHIISVIYHEFLRGVSGSILHSSSAGRRTPTTFEPPGSTTLAFYLHENVFPTGFNSFISYDRLSAFRVRNEIVVRISLYYEM